MNIKNYKCSKNFKGFSTDEIHEFDLAIQKRLDKPKKIMKENLKNKIIIGKVENRSDMITHFLKMLGIYKVEYDDNLIEDQEIRQELIEKKTRRIQCDW